MPIGSGRGPLANPDAYGRYHVVPPRLISSVDPEIPEAAGRHKLSGMVVVSLTVDEKGNPQDVRVTRSITDGVSEDLRTVALQLDENAVDAVKRYCFEPPTLQGKPVPLEISVAIAYRIK
jgi:TonB family protein